ncbi:hypothetical protein SNE40_016586 [Patella caerulea]|uniref:Uncharacterized protein n=1 Tax=Patella caerulea TaxID=87958 RepID=A0AAN8P8D9_PATCE
MRYELFLLVCVITITNAWFLNTERIVNAEREIEGQCQTHGSEGNCEFYNCFERRFPCRLRGYMLRYGSHYCRRFEDVDSYRHRFTPEGQEFLTASQQCMTRKLSERFYGAEEVNCHDLSHEAFNIMGDCYLDNGFCDIFWANKGAFSKVFEAMDLFDTAAFKIWREIGKLSATCGGQSASRFSSFIIQKLTNLGN